MKYLLIFVVIFLVAWKWRSARTADQMELRRERERKAAAPTEMVACAHCGVHVPARDAVTGQRGAYCCDAHRALAES
ncbi:MAG: hypothetical protein KGN32_01240 [Burkholderiales bacterium]|nr:hypothetical protein [Burkholderiales bacterium]